MNKIYNEVSEEFLLTLKKYIKGEVGISELDDVALKEKIIHNHKSWPSWKAALKERIFSKLKEIHSGIMEVDQCVRSMEKMTEGEVFNMEMGEILSHGRILGRNRAPEQGYEKSGWYVGPFPSLDMLDALNKKEDDHPQERED